MPAVPSKRKSPNIAWTRPEYTELLPRWNLIRDCIGGAIQVKKRGDVYLPRPNPTDISAENKARYEQYVQRAQFYGATGRTLQGLTGQVMSEDPVFKVPTTVEVLEDDMDGGGVSFIQQVTKALNLNTAYGRGGLLVDYPRVEGATTQAQLAAGEIRPTVMLVEPWDIINWRVQMIGGKVRLSKVVISESYVSDDDGFEQEWDPQWRVLYLDGAGLLVIEEWIVDPNDENEFIIKPSDLGPAQYFPTDSAGKRLDHVPFHFFGAVNNDPQPDLPPLYDLADLNIGHYRNSADYEEACYIVGQPTPVFTGLTEAWVKDVLKNTIQLGSRGAVPLPEGGAAMLLQAEPNTMQREAMEDKQNQMVALGAKLVQQQEVQRTATEATQDRAAETSTLAMIANNVSEAYEAAIRCALGFVDAAAVPDEDEAEDDSIEVELNTSFTANAMSSQDRAQLVAEWQAGVLTDEEMRRNMTRAGVASEDFETWKGNSEVQMLTKPIAAGPSALPGKGTPPPAKV